MITEGTKHWLQYQDLLQSYENSQGPLNNSAAHQGPMAYRFGSTGI